MCTICAPSFNKILQGNPVANTFTFNKAEIEALKPSKTRQYYQDEKVSRLGLCVTPKGNKSFFTRLTINGKSYRRAIGTFPDFTVSLARKQAILATAIVAEGNDPLQLKREKQIKYHPQSRWFEVTPSKGVNT